jgi:hypothetical protein
MRSRHLRWTAAGQYRVVLMPSSANRGLGEVLSGGIGGWVHLVSRAGRAGAWAICSQACRPTTARRPVRTQAALAEMHSGQQGSISLIGAARQCDARPACGLDTGSTVCSAARGVEEFQRNLSPVPFQVARLDGICGATGTSLPPGGPRCGAGSGSCDWAMNKS